MGTNEEYFSQLEQYYRRVVDVYSSSYTGEGRYRSNYFRLKILLNLLGRISERPKTVLEAGCGDARVVLALLHAGFDVRGFDFSDAMLEAGRRILARDGQDPSRIEKGNIYDIKSPNGAYDAVVCVGVIENLPDHPAIFAQFRRVLRPSGRLFLSLNNNLFSLFSMNKYSIIFLRALLNDIGLNKEVADRALAEIAQSYDVEAEKVVEKTFADADIDKSGMELTSYNPLNVRDQLREYGFAVEEIRYFHYHPLPPRFEARYPDLFKSFAETLESTNYDWRGGILCNCMLIQAQMIS